MSYPKRKLNEKHLGSDRPESHIIDDIIHKQKEEVEKWILNYLKEDVRQAQLGNVYGPHVAARSALRDFCVMVRRIVDYQDIKDEGRHLYNDFLSLNSCLSIGLPSNVSSK